MGVVQRNQELTALRFEHVLRHICGESKKIPTSFQHWMRLDEPRGGAEGYAEADLWRYLAALGKVTEIDVAFMIALERLSHKIAYLEDRIAQLESTQHSQLPHEHEESAESALRWL